MKVKNLGLMLGLSAVAGLSLPCGGTIAYNYASGNYGNTALAVDLGMDFSVGSTPVFVTQLGAWDNNQDGIAGSVTVALYKVIDTQTLQSVSGGSASFSGTTGTVIGGARWQSITPVQLDANTTYRVVASGYGSELWFLNTSPGQSSNLSTDSGGGLLTFGTSYYKIGTWQPYTGYGTPPWTAGTFDFTPVPEASQFAVAGVGLLGLVYIGRCAWQRRKGVA